MNKSDLITELQKLKVSEEEYSLEGELIFDRVILYHSYEEWRVFYLDERGGRNDERVFNSECEACWHIFKLFREAKEIKDKYK